MQKTRKEQKKQKKQKPDGSLTVKEKASLTARAYRYIGSVYPAGVCVIILSKILYGVYPVIRAALVSTFVDCVLTATAASLRQALVCLAVMMLLSLLLEVYGVFSNYMNNKFFTRMYVKSQLTVSDLIAGISSEYLDLESHQKRIDYILGNSMWAPFRLFNITTNLVQSVLSILVFFLFVGTKNLLCTAVFAGVLVLYIILLARMGEKEYALNVELFDKERQLGNINNIFYNQAYARELRIYQYDRYLLKRWKMLTQELRVPKLRLSQKNAGMKSLYAIIMNSVLLLFLISAGLGIRAGVMSVGMISAIAAFLPDLRFATSSLGEMSRSLKAQYGDLADLFGYQDQVGRESSTREGRSLDQPFREEIRFENVSFHYPGSERDVLKNFNLTLAQGEKVALVGENGAGKTTLAYLLMGAYRPTEGRILIDGIDYSDLSKEALQKKISFVSQKNHRLELSFEDNILLGREKRRDLDRLVREIGLSETVRQYPAQEKELLGLQFGKTEPSGGEWQKINILRCFAADAELYILDEPSSNLSPGTEQKLFEMFFRESSGKTAVIISHRLGALKNADRILYMEDGQICESGTHSQLMHLNGKYAEMFRTQGKWYGENEETKK